MKNYATDEAFALIGRKLAEEKSAKAEALTVLGQVEDLGGEQFHSVLPLGIEVSADASGMIKAVQLHSEGHEGFRAFLFVFEGLTLASSRSEVHDKLGSPVRNGLGRTGPWDVYRCCERSIHFMYEPDGAAIALVTVSA